MARVRKNAKKIGRPSLIHEQSLLDRVIERTRDGNKPLAAMVACGINRHTFYNWTERANNGEKEYLDFFDKMDEAEAEMQAQVVGQWVTVLPDKPQLIPEFLAKRFPDEWGEQKPSTNNISGEQVLIIMPAQASAKEWNKQVQQYLNGKGLDGDPKLT